MTAERRAGTVDTVYLPVASAHAGGTAPYELTIVPVSTFSGVLLMPKADAQIVVQSAYHLLDSVIEL